MMDLSKKKIPEAPQYDGGSTIIDRLKMVFGVSTRPQLSDYIGFSTGSMSTWQTRNTTPFEVICRVSLATGARLEWLLFGKGEMYEEQQAVKTGITFLKTEDGKVTTESEFSIRELDSLKPEDSNGLSVEIDDKIYFVDPTQSVPTTAAKYLISVNGICQPGELRQFPDGNIYYLENGDKYLINPDITKILGKITGILTRI